LKPIYLKEIFIIQN